MAVNFIIQIVGEDADSFQLLTEKQNAKHPCLDIIAIRSKLGDECSQYLPVIHAMSGCDTTSKLYGIGKSTVMKKRNHIIKEGGPFLSANVTPEEIEEAGRKIICLINDEKI